MTPNLRPSPDDLRAFCAGSLSPERFAAVDHWLGSLPDAEADRVLAEAGLTDAAAGTLSGLSVSESFVNEFITDLPRGRLRTGTRIGEGGMAIVTSAHDRVLNRTVAVKCLRPRRPDEALEHYHLREAAFRREAALTASLEHPAIPPVYDVGQSDGLPAFAMKRLDGQSFDALVRSGRYSLLALMDILLRVAEAVAYAHSRGIVHRDLTPHNILVSEYGAVYVLDWGLAARIGIQDSTHAGTPAWMAPEQAQAVPVHASMDVFGFGAVAFFAATGHSPRHHDTSLTELDLSLLKKNTVPRGLAALIHRCLAIVPTDRYPDASAVADDLRRWFTVGITIAQEASRWELLWLRVWHSPRIKTAVTVSTLAAFFAGCLWWWSAQQSRAGATTRAEHIVAQTPLDNAATIAVARDEVRAIAEHFPHLSAVQSAEARLQAAYDIALKNEQYASVRARLSDLLHRTRTLGPWADQVQAWRAAIRDAGLSMDPEKISADADIVRSSPLRLSIVEALAFLWRAEKERGADYHAEQTAALLAASGPTPAWQALGRLLGRSHFAAHDPIFCDCDDSNATLLEAEPAAIACALFAPEPRLTATARIALQKRPGDFWPLIASARAHLADNDALTTERLALIASGAEPDSVLPPVLLAYAALVRGDTTTLQNALHNGLKIDASNNELRVLHAVALARAGHVTEAQTLVDQLDAGHLQYHLHHAVGHPMERSVNALIAEGLHIPDAPADLGPLSPHHHNGH